MPTKFIIALPIESRRASHDFYRDALGLKTVGASAEDGIPEPLQFALDSHTSLMLIPSGGLEWVIGKGRLAPAGTSECLMSLKVADEAAVRAVFDRCIKAGASAVSEPSRKAWGYESIFTDPDGHLWMVTT